MARRGYKGRARPQGANASVAPRFEIPDHMPSPEQRLAELLGFSVSARLAAQEPFSMAAGLKSVRIAPARTGFIRSEPAPKYSAAQLALAADRRAYVMRSARVQAQLGMPLQTKYEGDDAEVLQQMAREEHERYTKALELEDCLKRKERQEVLHAARVAGKSGLSGPRYTQRSKVKC